MSSTPPTDQPENAAPFPMLDGPSITWGRAREIYADYVEAFGNKQTLERIAERGGFGHGEAVYIKRLADGYRARTKGRRTQGQAVSTPDLSVLEKLEATANAAWREVYHPSIGRGESINPVTNKERTYIDAVRADQAVAGWYLDHARQIKELIRLSAAQK